MSTTLHTTGPTYSKRQLTFAAFLFAVGLIGALLLYMSVSAHMGTTGLDSQTLHWMITHRSPSMTSFMEIVTNVLSPTVLAIAVPIGALLWGWRKKEIWRPLLLSGAMGATLVVSAIIKNIVQRGRPPTVTMVPPFELDYSFPSGHAIGITILLLVLGYLLYSRTRKASFLLAWGMVSIFIIVLVAASRLYLSYHWLTDVSASVAVAIAMLGVTIGLDSIVRSRYPRK